MLKKATAAVGITAAGMLAMAPMASADSKDNDGINILNDNNINAVSVQVCGNNGNLIGVVLPIASPPNAKCVNAPIVDHPKAD